MIQAFCDVCGIRKDMAKREAYPFRDDGLVSHPIPPLLEFESQPSDIENGDWKRIWLCHNCYHLLEKDMWTSQELYESMKPVIPHDELPNLSEDEV